MPGGRNYAVDLLKLFLAFSVALWHEGVKLLSGTMVVNYFFIISGYYLYESFASGKYLDTGAVGYTVQRVKRIYPIYLLSFIAMFLAVNANYMFASRFALASELINSLPELFLIQSSGVFDCGINYPLWQLSVLIIASHLLFALLQYHKNLTANVICPIAAIAFFTYVSFTGGNEDAQFGTVAGFIYLPLVRAFAGLSIGVFLHDPIDIFVGKIQKRKYAIRLLILLLLFGLLLYHKRNLDSLIVFVLIFAVCQSFRLREAKGIFKKIKIDKLALSIYCTHAFVTICMKQWLSAFSIEIRSIPGTAFYIFALVLYSLFLCWIADKGTGVCSKIIYKKSGK